ncbi:MAG: imelysin family protein [Pseudomonadota bacterium]
MRLALIFSVLCLPAFADVPTALNNHVLPRHTQLADATAALSAVAAGDCSPEAVRPAYHAAYDAWIGMSHIQFGPLEDRDLTLAMAFWPDPKDRVGKALARLSSASDDIVNDPARFGEVSAAAQGFTALERILYDPQPDADYACRLTQAIAVGLARKSQELAEHWPAFADLMLTAGQEGNTRFQSPDEARRALYTALSTGLEFLHDQRLGRPLGTYDRPRPRRAEAYRSERTQRHIELSLDALEDLAVSFTDVPLPGTLAAFADARERAAALNDPTLAGVAEPASRFRIEVLQQTVRAVQIAVIDEIGAPLGITAGFNSLDGD